MNQITSYTQPDTPPMGIASVQTVADQLAEFGRYEDNYIVHASEGETVIPMAVLDRNPDLKNNLFEQMRQMGLDPERYIVGNELNSINPVTGQPEFFLKKIGRGLKKAFKKIAPVVLPVLAASTPLGPIYGAMAGTGIASLAQGKSLKKSFRDALVSGGIAGLSRGLTGGMGAVKQDLSDFSGRLGQTFRNPFKGAPYLANPFKPETSKDPFRQGIYSQPATNTAQNNLIAEAKRLRADPTLSAFSEDNIMELARENVAKNAPNFLSKYGPTIGLGAVGVGALGGFDEPEDEEQVDFFADSPRYQPGTPLGDANQRLLTSGGVGQPRPFTPVAMEDVVVPSRFSTRYAAEGGEIDRQYFPPRIGAISGPGTGTSDDVPAMLSDGEFVMTADAVRGAGGGSREQGMRNMYDIMRLAEGGAVEDDSLPSNIANILGSSVPGSIAVSDALSPQMGGAMGSAQAITGRTSTRSEAPFTFSDMMDPEKRRARSEKYYEVEETVENFLLDKIAAGELPSGATVENLDSEQRKELGEALMQVRYAKMADYPYHMMPGGVVGAIGDIPKPLVDAAIGAMDLYDDFQDGTIGRPDLRKNLEGLERRQP